MLYGRPLRSKYARKTILRLQQLHRAGIKRKKIVRRTRGSILDDEILERCDDSGGHRMTRAERLVQQEARAKACLETAPAARLRPSSAPLGGAESPRLPLAAGGQTCRPAGLFVLDDAILESVFALICRLALLDDPVITLEALVGALVRSQEGQLGTFVYGTAQQLAAG